MTTPWQFIKEARAEMMKVVWPTRKEAIRLTLAVIGISLIVAAFLGAADYGFSQALSYFTNK